MTITFNSQLHPRDLHGRWRDTPDLDNLLSPRTLGAMPPGKNTENIRDVTTGSLIKTASGKRFLVMRHGKWTTVNPCDEYGIKTGKHTVLPPETMVEVHAAVEIPRVKLQDAPMGSIVRDLQSGKLYQVHETQVYTTLVEVDDKHNVIDGKEVQVAKGWQVGLLVKGDGIDPSTINRPEPSPGTIRYKAVYEGVVFQDDLYFEPNYIGVVITPDGPQFGAWLKNEDERTRWQAKQDYEGNIARTASLPLRKVEDPVPVGHITKNMRVSQNADGSQDLIFIMPDQAIHEVHSVNFGIMHFAAWWDPIDKEYKSVGIKPTDTHEDIEKDEGLQPGSVYTWRVHPADVVRPPAPSLIGMEGRKVAAVFDTDLWVDELESHDTFIHLEDLERLPVPLAKMLVDHGVRLHIAGGRTVPDMDSGDPLRSVQPRGYDKGMTWEDSSGSYSPWSKWATAGARRFSGSESTVLHELGHSIGDVFNLDNDQELWEHQRRLYPKLKKYYKQGGPGGRAGSQELLAESIAQYFKTPTDIYIDGPVHTGRWQYIADRYDEQYADWLESKLEPLSRGKRPKSGT